MLSVILGLGNVGGDYERTRHNVGFEVVRRVAGHLKAVLQPSTSEHDWAVKQHGKRQLVLAWPRTLMNRSGLSARALLEDNGLVPIEMLVVVDDFNLPLGRTRFRVSGSDGGHNGLASVIEAVQTEFFPRLRLGTGPLPDNVDVVDFVLGHFEEQELTQAEEMIDTAVEAVLFAIDHRFEETMTRYNVNPA